MSDSLRHRGPDDEGFYVAPGIELGMRRLAVIDVLGGHQPVTDESGNFVVVFNGEVYNFQDLRQGLESRGHTFRSHSDSEVIAHLYEESGPDMVHMLRGMFAIAVWNRRERTLFLARDHVGKKPLSYALTRGGLAFASETRALLRVLSRRGANLQAINHVLATGYVPAPENAFEGVKTLPPGSSLFWSNGTYRTWTYWSPNLTSSEPMSSVEAVERTSEVLDEAVRLRLVSERPLGAFLSGGIDSTVVTALMAKHHSGPVKTYTIGFEEAAFDESGYAREIARFLGTDHHELIIEARPLAMVADLAATFDQPFADSSAIPTLIVSQFARRDVVVALSGDGGDEAFGGYDRYLAAPALQRLNLALAGLAPIRSAMERAALRTGHRKAIRLAQELRPYPDLATRYMALMTLTSATAREELFCPEALETFSVEAPEAAFSGVWNTARAGSSLGKMMATDMVTYLPGDLLVKADIASMRHSLELRSPLLDRFVLEHAAKLPSPLRIRGSETKHVLREVARGLVPAHLIDRPKMGFAIPRAAWLRGPLAEVLKDHLTDNTARNRGWFRRDHVERLIREHRSGQDRDAILWPLLMIEVWAREWLD